MSDLIQTAGLLLFKKFRVKINTQNINLSFVNLKKNKENQNKKKTRKL